MVPPCFSLRSRFFFFPYTPCFPLDPVFPTRTRIFHQTPCFPPDPVFSTRLRVFHQTSCFALDPVFSTPHVFHTSGPHTPGSVSCLFLCLPNRLGIILCLYSGRASDEAPQQESKATLSLVSGFSNYSKSDSEIILVSSYLLSPLVKDLETDKHAY